MQFYTFIPVYLIDIAAAILVLVIVVGSVYKFKGWMKVVPPQLFKDARVHLKAGGITKTALSELANRVIAQRGILNDSTVRRITHLAIFWGFIGLGFATVWDDVFFHDGALPSPFSLQNLGNIVGNVAGAVLVIGLTVVVIRYLFVERFSKNKQNGDYAFLVLLYIATISGFATEFSRYSTSTSFADFNYALHLALVAGLLITAPFSHFFHALLSPFMRFVESLQARLVSLGVSKYPFYRREEMAKQAEDIRQGTGTPTAPDWLVPKKENEPE